MTAAVADPGTPVSNPESAPYNGIVTIYDEIGNQYYQGTGVLISPDEVLTAAHVVYSGNGTAGQTATDIEVYPSAGDQFSFGTLTHYNPIDDSNDMISLSDTQDDYAIIHLATPFTGDTIFSLDANYADTAPQQTAEVNTAGYPSSADGALVAYTGAITVDPYFTTYFGASLGPGSSGGPVWFTNTDGEPTEVGIVSSYDTQDTDPTTSGNDVELTTAALNQIETWVTDDDGTKPPVTVSDITSGELIDPQPIAYTGPVAGLSDEYINVSADNLNISLSTNNWFVHSGAGEDAIAVHGGTNVIDGGTGSNFLVGGSGTDTFFTDDRGATASIWDTLVNFHAGDAATIFGVTQADFSFQWVDGQGAAGYTGLTLHATEAGNPVVASVTLDGFTSADLTNGVLSISYGVTSGSPYMYIKDNG